MQLAGWLVVQSRLRALTLPVLLPPSPLQRHPGKWVVQAAEPGSSDQLPAVVLPSIEEVFPLDKCLQVGACEGSGGAVRARQGAFVQLRACSSGPAFCYDSPRPVASPPSASRSALPGRTHDWCNQCCPCCSAPLPQVPGINHYESVIEAVYEYWKGKHQRAGRPLIQRLW